LCLTAAAWLAGARVLGCEFVCCLFVGDVRPAAAVAAGDAGVAYFINDCIETRAQWLSNPSFLLHHLLGAGMAAGAMVTPHPAPVAPYIIMAEGSTLFLNPMQALRVLGLSDTPLHARLSVAFAASFLVLRCLILPWAMYNIATQPTMRHRFLSLGPARHTFAPMAALQYFWAWKIVSKILSGGASAATPSGS
jgi:hypothetical protein